MWFMSLPFIRCKYFSVCSWVLYNNQWDPMGTHFKWGLTVGMKSYSTKRRKPPLTFILFFLPEGTYNSSDCHPHYFQRHLFHCGYWRMYGLGHIQVPFWNNNLVGVHICMILFICAFIEKCVMETVRVLFWPAMASTGNLLEIPNFTGLLIRIHILVRSLGW